MGKNIATLILIILAAGTFTQAKAGNPTNHQISGFCDIPADSLLTEAFKFLGTPYHFGGTTPNGFDCSGLVKFVFDKIGVELPRTSKNQASNGEKISPAEAKKGDLVFFGKSATSISHVGIVVSNPGEPLKIVHSASSQGVSVTDVFSSNYWSAKFKFIKRVIPFWGDDEPVKQLLAKSKTHGK